VIIPHQNVDGLMLKTKVVEAVKQGKFHIYPVKTIDQGIEILTGMKAGGRKEDGIFEEGSVNFLVDKQLKAFAETWKDFARGEIPTEG